MRILLVLFFACLTIIGCDKTNQPEIPYVYVNLQLYPNSMDYIPIGGNKYVNGGHRGLIVYRILEDQFVIYERCCPYDPEISTARVNIDASGITCSDSTCKSQFLLHDGSPLNGPSPYMLMQYRYSFDGDVLQIYN